MQVGALIWEDLGIRALGLVPQFSQLHSGQTNAHLLSAPSSPPQFPRGDEVEGVFAPFQAHGGALIQD